MRGDGTYAQHISPYVRALGRVDFGQHDDASATANRASERLRVHWQQLMHATSGRVGAASPVRAMAKHYPLEGAPGRCVVLQLELYTTPDRYLDGADITDHHDEHVGERELPGFVLRLRAVYQLEASRPLLVEARVEVQEDFRYGGARFDYPTRLGLAGLRPDGNLSFHFDDLEPGVRSGLLWFDRSYGVGAPQEASAAYVLRRRVEADPETPVTAVPAAWVRALRDLVERI